MVNEGINEIIPRIDISENSKILDIGCFGRRGQNTSNVLVSKFYNSGHIDGLNLGNAIPKQYSNINLIQKNYFDFKTDVKYDLVCCDLGGLGQLTLIEDDLTTKLYDMLNENGILIFYIFTNNNYTSYRTEISNHIKNYWSWNTPNVSMNETYIANKSKELYSAFYDVISVDTEKIRPYITWIVLKKI